MSNETNDVTLNLFNFDADLQGTARRAANFQAKRTLDQLATDGRLTETLLRQLFTASEGMPFNTRDPEYEADAEPRWIPIVALWVACEYERFGAIDMDHAAYLRELLEHPQWGVEFSRACFFNAQVFQLVPDSEREQMLELAGRYFAGTSTPLWWVGHLAYSFPALAWTLVQRLIVESPDYAVAALLNLREWDRWIDSPDQITAVVEALFTHGYHSTVIYYRDTVARAYGRVLRQQAGQSGYVSDEHLCKEGRELGNLQHRHALTNCCSINHWSHVTASDFYLPLTELPNRDLLRICQRFLPERIGCWEATAIAACLLKMRPDSTPAQNLLQRLLANMDEHNAPFLYRWALLAGMPQLSTDERQWYHNGNSLYYTRTVPERCSVFGAWFHEPLWSRLADLGWMIVKGSGYGSGSKWHRREQRYVWKPPQFSAMVRLPDRDNSLCFEHIVDERKEQLTDELDGGIRRTIETWVILPVNPAVVIPGWREPARFKATSVEFHFQAPPTRAMYELEEAFRRENGWL